MKTSSKTVKPKVKRIEHTIMDGIALQLAIRAIQIRYDSKNPDGIGIFQNQLNYVSGWKGDPADWEMAAPELQKSDSGKIIEYIGMQIRTYFIVRDASRSHLDTAMVKMKFFRCVDRMKVASTWSLQYLADCHFDFGLNDDIAHLHICQKFADTRMPQRALGHPGEFLCAKKVAKGILMPESEATQLKEHHAFLVKHLPMHMR